MRRGSDDEMRVWRGWHGIAWHSERCVFFFFIHSFRVNGHLSKNVITA